MNSFYPVFFILFVLFITAKGIESQRKIIKASKRRKENEKMDNSALSRYIGKICTIQANGYIAGLQGKITDVSGNWITVEDKKGKLTTFNCDYVSSVKEK